MIMPLAEVAWTQARTKLFVDIIKASMSQNGRMPSTTSAIVLREVGEPQVLRLEQVPLRAPSHDELLLRQTAIGVNFHDCYVRSGLYQTSPLPGTPGLEACGVVEAVGDGVTGFTAGDRVAYVTEQYGAYAQRRCLAASLALKVPDAVSDQLAASLMVKGLTAAVLLHQVHQVTPGCVILVHAAAGSIGKLLGQWAAHLGAVVIGTVGSAAKEAVAAANGCRHVINYANADFADEVKRLTEGRGADVVYDSVGKDTFTRSLQCLAPLGHLVNFGQSSGPVEPFAPSQLAVGSYSVTRPILFHYIADRERLERCASLVFDALARGVIRVDTVSTYPLAEASRAHQDLEERRMAGSPVLLP
jgi:NADPH2:quinone reductase